MSKLVDIGEHKDGLAKADVLRLVELSFEKLEREGKAERFTDAAGETRWRRTALREEPKPKE